MNEFSMKLNYKKIKFTCSFVYFVLDFFGCTFSTSLNESPTEEERPVLFFNNVKQVCELFE